MPDHFDAAVLFSYESFLLENKMHRRFRHRRTNKWKQHLNFNYLRNSKKTSLLRSPSSLPDFMYGPLRFTRTDLVAMTIQRGRDFGLRSYTEVRKSLNLPPVTTFRGINPELCSTNPQVEPGQVNPKLRDLPEAP